MLKCFLFFIVIFTFSPRVEAQTSQDATRDLWDTAFIKKRPVAKAPSRRVAPVRYRMVGRSSLTPSNSTAGGPAVVGVTVWRLRPSKTSDEAEVRELIHRQGEWTPERVGGGTP